MIRRVQQRIRFERSARFEEPIVVIESDDWGLRRGGDVAALSRYGPPGRWALETRETAADLDSMYELLRAHRGADGQNPILTANFIMSNPDHERIAEDGFTTFHFVTLDQDIESDVVDAYRRGLTLGVFHPELHGATHFNVGRWLHDLRADVPGARDLMRLGVDGGLALIEGNGWRYHSEYLDWHTGNETRREWLSHTLGGAIATFERMFGYKPTTTAAPHYIFERTAIETWRELAIRAVQATGYRIRRTPKGGQKVVRHYLGQRVDGLTFLTRTVRFDPRPGREPSHWREAAEAAHRRISIGLPVVIDMHRVNVVGKNREPGLEQLHKLLTSLDQQEVLYLTTEELAQAVSGGSFDRLPAGPIQLTPIHGRLQPRTRERRRA